MSDNKFDTRTGSIFNAKAIELIQSKKVLDLGSHEGQLANLCLSLGSKSVIGLDINKYSIEKSKKTYPQIEFNRIDISSDTIREFVDRSEVVLCLGILYLLKDQRGVLNTVFSNLNIKSVIVENAYSENDLIVENLFDILSPASFKEIFAEAGFNLLYENKYRINVRDPYMNNRVCLLFNRD